MGYNFVAYGFLETFHLSYKGKKVKRRSSTQFASFIPLPERENRDVFKYFFIEYSNIG